MFVTKICLHAEIHKWYSKKKHQYDEITACTCTAVRAVVKCADNIPFDHEQYFYCEVYMKKKKYL